MTRDEAAMKLSTHLMQCGMMMPIEWVEKNGEGSELMEAFSMAISALSEQEELARNSHDVASCEQVTETLCRSGSSDSEESLATENQVKGIRMMQRPWQPQDLLDDLQLLIDEEPDRYLNDRRTTLCMARDFLKEHFSEPDWVSVADSLPQEFVSVLGYMTDAGEFPAVRECYLVGGAFFFPALRDIHPVSHWKPMPTKED